MRRLSLLFGFLILFIHSSQAQTHNPWEQVIPKASFGYGGLQSVYWSPLNGQLAAVSESGFQFYSHELELEGERRFEVPLEGQVLFSPDMRYAAVEEFGGLLVRDTTTWQPVLALGSYAYPAWSPNSRYLAVWAGAELQIWDVQAGETTLKITELVSEGGVVQWSPDSAVLAVSGPGAIVMVRSDTGDIVRIHPFALIQDFAWSADGQWFAVIGIKDPLPLDRKLDDPDDPILYDLLRVDAVTGDVVMTYDLSSGGIEGTRYGAERFVAISPNGRYLAASLAQWQPLPVEQKNERWRYPGMGIWELESGSPLHNFADFNRPLAYVSYLSWAPDGEFFASSSGNALQIYDAGLGQVSSSLQAYIYSTGQTIFTDDGNELVAAGGLWDVSGDYPVYLNSVSIRDTSEDVYYKPYYTIDEDFPWLNPSPYVYDYNRPPYRYELREVYPDSDLLVTYEIDIEYPGTPEYEDEEPPAERFVVWDIAEEARHEERLFDKLQAIWLYDLNPEGRAGGNTYRNIIETTRFIAIGDDEIVDLRTKEVIPLEGVQRWEWREVFFSPDGAMVMAYDTDGRFKAFDPVTGKFLYQTVPAVRNSIYFTRDLTRLMVMDSHSVLYIYDAKSGDLLLETYTANTRPILLWSQDRTRLAIGGENRAILIYDMLTRSRVAILRGHQGAITSMDWNPACDYTDMTTCRYVLASSDSAGQVILWGMSGGDRPVVEVPVSPAMPSLALPTPAVDYATLSPLWTYVAEGEQFGRSEAYAVVWSEDGIRVNSDWYYDPTLTLLEEDNVHWRGVENIADQTLAGQVVTSNGTLLDAQGQYVEQVGHSGVNDAIFNADGTRVLTAESGGYGWLSGYIRVWSSTSGQPVTFWGGGSPGYNHIALSPDGQWYATATVDYYNAGGRGQIWYADRRNVRYSSLIGHTDTITALYWYGEHVVTSSLDGSVRLWDIHTGLQLARWRHASRAPIVDMEWTPGGGMLLASAGRDLVMLNPSTLAESRVYEGIGGGQFDWSPDGTQVVVIGADSVVRVMRFPSGEVVAEERRHMPAISQMAWHPDGTALAVARSDGSVVLLDSRTGMLTRTLRLQGPRVRSMSWYGSRLLLDKADGTIEILNGDTGETLMQTVNQWKRRGVWWSPDGKAIAFGTYPDPDMGVTTSTSLVWVLDSETGRPIHQFSLDWDDYIWYWEVKPFRLAWSPDGRYLLAFYGGRLRLWDVDSGVLLTTHTELDKEISLTHWNESQVDFWSPNGQWRFDLTANRVWQVSRTGLAPNALLRQDEKVVYSGDRILDFGTFYPLQQIGNYAAVWHPSCWSDECPAVLAVASGSNIIMYGYPR